VHDVEVDVRGLVAIFGQEALEQEVHSDGIDSRDAEAIAHSGVRRRTATLAEDFMCAAILDDFVHGEKVSTVIELFDEMELSFELVLYFCGDITSITTSRSFEAQMMKPFCGSLTIGQPFGRVSITQFIE
jgi:hypothetical protein